MHERVRDLRGPTYSQRCNFTPSRTDWQQPRRMHCAGASVSLTMGALDVRTFGEPLIDDDSRRRILALGWFKWGLAHQQTLKL